MNYQYRVVEADTGLEVARVSAATIDDAGREVLHYANQYAQDGPVYVEQYLRRRWRRVNVAALVLGLLNERDIAASRDATPSA